MALSADDWITLICTIVATVVALVTLLTVYVAAVQLLTQRRIYRLGLSSKSLGPWEPEVVSSSLLRLQTEIVTPRFTVPNLVKKKWEPSFTFPTGFSIPNRSSCFPHSFNKGATERDPEAGLGLVLADTSWVNFLQALGLGPDAKSVYEMRNESELVNGIVPMRWKGKDLVAICSILGFQSHEKDPSHRTPMPLPMQWSGPLGWVQFRTSSDGCIAEFRVRRKETPQVSKEVYSHFNDVADTSFPRLVRRLWYSTTGFYIDDGHALYLGGSDRDSRDTVTAMHQESSDRDGGADGDSREKLRSMLQATISNLDGDSDGDSRQTLRSMLQASSNLDGEEVAPADADASSNLDGEEVAPADADASSNLDGEEVAPADADASSNLDGEEVAPADADASSNLDGDGFADGLSKIKQREVFFECPGLISRLTHGELMHSRGLGLKHCTEYRRKYTPTDKVDPSTHPYQMGTLCMNLDLLKAVKKAVIELKPDGFYFTPTKHLAVDAYEFFRHVDTVSDKLNKQLGECKVESDELKYIIFPKSNVDDWSKHDDCSKHDTQWKTLYYVMVLCNDLQRIKKLSKAGLTIEDIILLSKASASLRHIFQNGVDLRWAFMVSPELFFKVAKRYIHDKMEVEKVVTFQLRSEGGNIVYLDRESNDPPSTTVPLLEADRDFSSKEVLAAFADVFLTYFWTVELNWISNVADYDATIPQSVTMC